MASVSRASSWSWRIGRIAGIDISVHFTFLLLLLLYLLDGLGSALFLVLVFGCIVLHELGHALAARSFGIETRGIMLLPFGGVAQLERMPRNPWQELVIALAGPAVNFALVLVLGLVLLVGHGAGTLLQIDLFHGTIVEVLLAANLILGLVNLVPAFPMDGGRVLRALLAMRLDYVIATDAAARVGRTLAVIFGVYGLLSLQLALVLIAVFVYFSATAEAEMVRRQRAWERARDAGGADFAEFADFDRLIRRHLEQVFRARAPGGRRGAADSEDDPYAELTPPADSGRARRSGAQGRPSCRRREGAVRDVPFSVEEY